MAQRRPDDPDQERPNGLHGLPEAARERRGVPGPAPERPRHHRSPAPVLPARPAASGAPGESDSGLGRLRLLRLVDRRLVRTLLAVLLLRGPGAVAVAPAALPPTSSASAALALREVA